MWSYLVKICYSEDIDYTEEVEYISEYINKEIIKKYLIEISKN